MPFAIRVALLCLCWILQVSLSFMLTAQVACYQPTKVMVTDIIPGRRNLDDGLQKREKIASAFLNPRLETLPSVTTYFEHPRSFYERDVGK